MKTTIKITPLGGAQYTIKTYNKVIVNRSSTGRIGKFSIEMTNFDSSLVDKFPVGSDVQIDQDGHLFRGWLLNPARSIEGKARTMVIDGFDYTFRTQKIVVTEAFVNERIDVIVQTLFNTYVPWVNTLKIEDNSTRISIRFPDIFLFDAMETLCKLSGFEWYIDHELSINFFAPEERINPIVLDAKKFRDGSCTLKPDATKLVNKLLVKGGKTLSDNFTQNIAVQGHKVPIPLFYTPRATTEGVQVIIGGVQRSLGIQYIDPEGTKDFLINFNEKLLIPDLVTSGSGTVTYRYEYPIKFELEDPESQGKYGLFVGVLHVDTTDRKIALDLGLRHLSKYANPVLNGSLEPFAGIYQPGELVRVEVPNLKFEGFLKIRTVEYISTPNTGKVRRLLSLETPEVSASAILKDHEQRLRNLEREVYRTDEGPVERYITPTEERWGWREQVTQSIHACPIPTDDRVVFVLPWMPVMSGLWPSDDLYPC